MSRNKIIVMPDALRAALEASGMPWRTEPGTKHVKVYIGDRMVTVFSYGRRRDRGEITRKNVAEIRRFAAGSG